MKLYKLTDNKYQTVNMQWGENITHSKGELYIDAFSSPLMASLFGLDYNVLWECEGEVYTNAIIKIACNKLTTIKIINLPEITLEQRVEIAINCAKEACKEKGNERANKNWNEWADNWLSNKDRSFASANSAVANYAIFVVPTANTYAAAAAWAAAWSAFHADYNGNRNDVIACVANAIFYAASKRVEVCEVIEKIVNE
jgi:hypothetical protein